MPTIPEPFIRPDYAGLNDAEDRLLARFLRQTADDVTGLETRVVVGPGEQLDEAQPESFRRAWQESSKLKIDAVVHRSGVTELVELKDFIRTSHLGQILSYRYWYSVERQPDEPIRLVAAAPDINPSAVQPSRFHNVNLHLLTPEGRIREEAGAVAQPPFE